MEKEFVSVVLLQMAELREILVLYFREKKEKKSLLATTHSHNN